MASKNPDPARITDEMWRLWEEAKVLIPGVKLGGIYADKRGYHNTVIANQAKWPGNYSIRFLLDLVNYNRKYARGLDLTMSEAEMIKWTTRMRKSALDPFDNRLSAVREFYGTLDGENVYGLIKDDAYGPWRKTSSDRSHLWHGHLGIFTAFVNNWEKLSPLVSVWEGETLAAWKEGDMDYLPKQGDKGENVKYWQYVHNNVRFLVEPPSPEVTLDGDYGPKTAAGFADFWKKSGGKSEKPFLGQLVTGWLAYKYHAALATKMARQSIPPVPNPISVEQMQEIVNEWLNTNMPGSLHITGTIDGTVTRS